MMHTHGCTATPHTHLSTSSTARESSSLCLLLSVCVCVRKASGARIVQVSRYYYLLGCCALWRAPPKIQGNQKSKTQILLRNCCRHPLPSPRAAYINENVCWCMLHTPLAVMCSTHAHGACGAGLTNGCCVLWQGFEWQQCIKPCSQLL